MSSSLNIGLLAYYVDRSKVFVRVPNERGRWLLTDRCVVEVDCPYCEAISGEPCRGVTRDSNGKKVPHLPIRYHVGTHYHRRDAWGAKAGRFSRHHAPPHKLHLTAADLADLQREPVDELLQDPVDIDVIVTPKEPSDG